MGVIPEELYLGEHDLAMMWGTCVGGGTLYLKQNPLVESLVLGISGGMDSAITAALGRAAAKAVGAKLYGYSLPILSNKEDEIERARFIGDTFCDHFSEVNLSNQAYDLIKPIDNSLWHEWNGDVDNVNIPAKIRVGNIKARLRMMYLYDKANKYNGMVLSTDNYTEFLLGFWTLHGDVGDFGFIQELFKTEVYAMAEYAVDVGHYGADALAPCLDAVATDGLGVSNSDLDQLLPGFKGSSREGYFEIDKILVDYANADSANAAHPVIERHIKSSFKRQNPVSLERLRLVGLID